MDTRVLALEFLAAKEAKHLSPRTLDSYRRRLQAFTAAFPTLPTEPEQIESYMRRFTNAGMMETQWRMLANLYKWTIRRRKLLPQDNPMVYAERPEGTHTIPRAFTGEEMRLLFSHPHAGYMRLLLTLLRRTGIRLGEAISLQPESLKDTTIVVTGKTGPREIPCHPELLTVLKWMLPWPWKDAMCACHAVIRAMRAAGLSGERASAHTLRHSFARAWTGELDNLQGILWGGPSRMLMHYRPYDVRRAQEEYQQQDWAV